MKKAKVELTAGKKLSEARLARGLTLDAAAHATRMRPDKILALENDDYTRFGSTSYAKSFLLLYGRYLKVDVSTELQDLKTTDHRVNIQEYQYLNNAPPPPKEEPRMSLPRRRAKGPSLLPLAAVACLLLAVVAYFEVKDYAQRLRRLDTRAEPALAKTESEPLVSAPAPEGAPAAVAEAVAPVRPEPAAAVAAETPAPAPAPVINELSVESLKKTYVTIRKERNSPVLWEDYLYPGKLVKMRDTNFFVEVADGASVQIRKNGQPIAYAAPGIVVE